MSKTSSDFVKIGDLEFSRPSPIEDAPVENCDVTLRRGNLQATLTVRECRNLFPGFAELAKGVSYTVGCFAVGTTLQFIPDASGNVVVAVELSNSSEKWTVSAKFIVPQDEIRLAHLQLKRFLRL